MSSRTTNGDENPSGPIPSDEYSHFKRSHGRFRFKSSSSRGLKRRDKSEEDDPFHTSSGHSKRHRTRSMSRTSARSTSSMKGASSTFGFEQEKTTSTTADISATAENNGGTRGPTSDTSHTDEKPPERDSPSYSRSPERHHKHRHRHSHSHRDRDRDRDRVRDDRHRSRRSKHKSSPGDSHRKHTNEPFPQRGAPLSPNAAFRESLFDALGDDEGAAYWETVYGQPIHNYPIPEIPRGPDGELEQMTDEEYAAYVRSRMWERTREGMLEEQERLREERRRAKHRDRGGDKARERDAFERAMEESLRRGAERKRRKNWEAVWKDYVARWEEIAKVVEKTAATAAASASASASTDPTESITEQPSKDVQPPRLQDLLFWPVESGKRRDVNPDSVRDFLRHAPSGDLLSSLKAERVRWHPDKIQHRYSVLGLDDDVMKSVTEVFQIVDRMWSEQRGPA
ncbi:hypothetical protein N7539_005921 [Penicillium diatomitis]|uniref:NF-kappa-B inhibitor-like protein 1 n=1 Tax=Penicillium diatomitis TaxID=2819901 RepID=A0A9W9X5R2_9EURO|nr:uncharacterized protein N7539_005921 [Penicillium diatomitis]KAJ5484125.1 hypothetical protein N7539_005921 [Penicillium diatomitis]